MLAERHLLDMSTKRTWTGNYEKNWGDKQKSGGAMAHPAPPLVSPLYTVSIQQCIPKCLISGE